MNFQLPHTDSNTSSSKKKQKTLSLGLNQRGGMNSVNVLGGGDEDEDDNDSDEQDKEQVDQSKASSRSRVNMEIAREQAALRKRAQLQALAIAAEDTNNSAVYDYDGAYDSFKQAQQQETNSKKQQTGDDKKSRYIADLLRTAEERQRERELRIERKVVKEQAAEEAEGDFSDKGRFVTAAYKRKLQERSLWLQDQAMKEKLEQEADVTKQGNSQVAMASFYSNLNKNVAFGGGDSGSNEGTTRDEEAQRGDDKSKLGFQQGFEREAQHPNEVGDGDGKVTGDASSSSKTNDLTQRQLRQQKVVEARKRYFERHPERRREAAES